MTRTARRRWSREFQGEVDGIVLGEAGPVFLHGYDPPAGGKWIDNVIPGKLGAFDRNNGDPKHGPNPCIGPIKTPPYYAMAVYPSTLGSSIGLKADADGRVLDGQARKLITQTFANVRTQLTA